MLLHRFSALVVFASLIFCVAGAVLLFVFSIEIFVSWYSAVRYEPPRTQIGTIVEWIRMAIVCAAIIVVFFEWFLPGIRW